jgi:DNA-binding GntR family transcriptional regulator
VTYYNTVLGTVVSPAGEDGLIIKPILAAEYVASDEELARLGLFAGEMVYRISRLRREDSQLRAEDVRLPCALFPGLLHKDIFANISSLAGTYGLVTR